jgi:hypothetical protein
MTTMLTGEFSDAFTYPSGVPGCEPSNPPAR